MWDASFDNDFNGGFVNDKSQGSATKKKGDAKRVQSLVPVFVNWINESTDEDFNLFGMPVQMVDIVGVIRKFSVQSTKATCEIQDHSGTINAILWFESDGDTVTSMPAVKENCYVRVYGSIRTQEGQKIIMILKIIPFDDCNIITHHHMQAIHAKLYAEKSANGALPSVSAAPNPVASMSFSTIGNEPEPQAGMSSMQFKVMTLLKSSTDYIGIAKGDILKHFGPGHAKEVNETLDFLLNEGHAYTTCDNEHFKATDAF